LIKLAQRTARQGEFQVSSLYEAELRPCCAVTALGEALNYCARGIPTAMLSGALFKNIAVKLEQSGVFAFDVIVKKSPCLIARLRSGFSGRDA